MPDLIFIRHGETDWNAEGRLQGQRDIPLNARGRRQADEVGALLRRVHSLPETLPFVASPLTRTRDTMERVRLASGLPPDGYAMDDRLKELTFGRWEGLTWKEVRRADPAGAAARERDKWGFVPPDGESYAMLTERIRGWLSSVDRTMVVVAHGGVARAMLTLIGGVAPQQATSMDIWQGRILLFRDGTSRWIGP